MVCYSKNTAARYEAEKFGWGRWVTVHLLNVHINCVSPKKEQGRQHHIQ